MTFDYIIVGGGTAGCVLANRLSAKPQNKVLLLEAGEDTPPGEVAPEILDSFAGMAYLNERFLWNDLRVTTEPCAPDRPDKPRLRKYEQAKVLGGGSSINGQLANRGAPADYDEWAAQGAKGWNWENVRPYFRKLERDCDFDGPLHGQSGPIAISRVPQELWPGHAKAFARALDQAGYAYVEDQNGEFVDGYYPVAISNIYDRRVSASIGYLTSTVRRRPNLTILTNTQVSRLVMQGRRCVGVRTVGRDGQETEYRGGEIIVSSGAIYSPAHLLRAGIGPAAELQAMGIEVVADRPGVGRGLMDHPAVAIASFVLPHARINGRTRRHLMLGLRMSSGMPGIPRGDMAVSIATKSAWHAVGEQLATVNIWVNKTYSDRGVVELTSPDWRAQPRVDFNLLSDHRDIERLKQAFRQMAAVILSPIMKEVTTDPFPASYSDKVRQVAAITPMNRFLTSVLARLLDGPAFLRRALIRNLILEGDPLETLLANDKALEAFVRKAAVGVWHASCSCRMGSDSDPMAVLDERCRVRGVAGLRVVDASVFPTIPSANTCIPTIMVAERVSDLILEESGQVAGN